MQAARVGQQAQEWVGPEGCVIRCALLRKMAYPPASEPSAPPHHRPANAS